MSYVSDTQVATDDIHGALAPIYSIGLCTLDQGSWCAIPQVSLFLPCTYLLWDTSVPLQGHARHLALLDLLIQFQITQIIKVRWYGFKPRRSSTSLGPLMKPETTCQKMSRHYSSCLTNALARPA